MASARDASSHAPSYRRPLMKKVGVAREPLSIPLSASSRTRTAAGRVLQLDNFRRLRGYGWPGFTQMNLWRQDKGQAACAQAFVDAVRHARPAPIPLSELLEVGKVSIVLQESLR